MPDALDSVRAELRQRGREWIETREGLAVEFQDGCDALFLARDEPPDDARTWCDEFGLIDDRRWCVVCGIRHYAFERGVHIERCDDGSWNAQFDTGSSGEVNVGNRLTAIVREHEPAEALRLILKGSALRPPSPKRAARLAALGHPPQEELSEPTDVDDLGDAVGQFVACQALDEAVGTAEGLNEKAQQVADEPGMRVMRILQDRLGGMHSDLLKPGCLEIDFSDGMDQLEFVPRGKRVAWLIERHGDSGAAKKLTEEYERLNRARSLVLRAVRTLMAQRDYAEHEDGYGFMEDVGLVFGRTHQELRFPAGRALTRSLRKRDEVSVIWKWLKSSPGAPLVSEDEIRMALQSPAVEPIQRHLPPEDPLTVPRLPHLHRLDRQQVDAAASELIDALRRDCEAIVQDQDHPVLQWGPMGLWNDPAWYTRPRDVWADEQWWIPIARWLWSERKDQTAALLLLMSGEDSVRTDVLSLFAKHECYHYEAFDEGLIWWFKDELPWPMEQGEWPEYPERLGSPPSDVARKEAVFAKRSVEQAVLASGNQQKLESLLRGAVDCLAGLDRESASDWLDAAQLERLQEMCMKHIRTMNQDSGWFNSELFTVARQFGWVEIGTAMAENPDIDRLLLEEDGPAYLGRICMPLSSVQPCELAARAASACLLVSEETAQEETEREIAASGIRSDWAAAARLGYLRGREQSRVQSAIAWRRCREVGVV